MVANPREPITKVANGMSLQWIVAQRVIQHMGKIRKRTNDTMLSVAVTLKEDLEYLE